MNPDELRAAFARQEVEELDVYELRKAIDGEAGRRRRRRAMALTGGLAAVVALAIAVPLTLLKGTVPIMNVVPQIVATGPARPVNLLLLGLDTLGSMPDARTDTIMIVHIPASRERVYLISLERDLGVEIPGHGRDKINAAYFYGGAALTSATVTKLTGVTFDGVVTLKFGAMKKIVDSLGGVDVCLDAQIKSIHTGRTYRAECQHLDGARAADLIRQRRGLPNGGYDRDRNGQRVFAAMAAKASGQDLLTNPAKLAELMRVDGVSTNLGNVGAAELAMQLKDVQATNVVGIGAPSFRGVNLGGAVYETLWPEAPKLFSAIVDDTVETFVLANPKWVTTMKS